MFKLGTSLLRTVDMSYEIEFESIRIVARDLVYNVQYTNRSYVNVSIVIRIVRIDSKFVLKLSRDIY
jgi:hypothetical protein